MQTPPMDAMPADNSMAAPFGGDSVDPSMGMNEPQQNQPQENFEADFDAGVEANEDEDPKKFIQQLTGKLSQSLRKYNQSLPQPDAELSKYVAGMILKQATDGLSQKDVADIVKKADSDAGEQDTIDNAEAQLPSDNVGMEQNEVPMNETTASSINPTSKEDTKAPIQMIKGGYSRKPYRTTI